MIYSTPRSQVDSLPHFGGDNQLGLLGPAFVGRPLLSDVSTGDWICSRVSVVFVLAKFGFLYIFGLSFILICLISVLATTFEGENNVTNANFHDLRYNL